MKRASFLIAALLAQTLIAGLAAGQAPYPSRPITIIVPAATGSSPDILGRSIAQKLSERWGQQVLVDNRAGAGGIVGAELAADLVRTFLGARFSGGARYVKRLQKIKDLEGTTYA